ncbi:2667_t:CDS:2 [Cetraspora pellucida]|uniref:2667_t:CDS:1 n=1 Tax=Cetraspora pellucida TaxID=1433469 RepID=A0A9N9JHY8_9GLOM|nr:2667_t:CDS:2 [Cetraspora pellucida]
MRRANAKKAREKKELKDKDKDDLPIVDDAYDLENDEAAETVFRKLIENAKEMDYNKNSRWRYTGNSDLNNINEATGDQQSDSESDSDLELEEKPLKWKQQLQETEKRIQNLLDTMEMSKTDKVKYVSVIHYIRLLQHDSSKMEASRVVATIHNGGNLLPPSQRGKHPSQSLLHDEEVSLKVANYLRSTKFKVNPRLVKQYFENNILPELHIDQVQTISLTTARRWMKKIGFYYKRYQKGVYVDDHEREDVVAYHKVFLQNMAEYKRLMPKWTDVDCKVCEEPYLLPGEQKHILINHDECTFHSYDGTREFWAPEGKQPLRKKGLGKGLHVSEFLVETIGRLKDEKEEARLIMQLGANHDGYWDGQKLLPQVKNAIDIFETTHPGYIGVWAFDNATSHKVMAPDALVAARINLKPGGQQPKMRNTVWNGETQTMVFPEDYEDDPTLQSELKGMKQILKERGLWKDGMLADCKVRKKDKLNSDIVNCCAQHLIANQPDFLNERGLIQQEIEKHGHKVIFYPKFHPELNYIETYWGAAKRHARENCDYTWKGLQENVPIALDSVPVEMNRKYARLSYQWMDTYRKGLTGRAAEYAVKKQRSHRSISLVDLVENGD